MNASRFAASPCPELEPGGGDAASPTTLAGLPPAEALYHPRDERDACGVGFVADLRGRRSHDVLRLALGALERLGHRGAVSADGLSGDGAGVLTQLPHELFEIVVEHAPLEQRADLGVAMCFLPRDRAAADDVAAQVARGVAELGIEVIGWREVPVQPEVLGQIARSSCPRVRQLFVRRPAALRGADGEPWERLLYRARRRVEHRLGPQKLHVASFSHRTIVYKGLMAAPQLARFYLDLGQTAYRTSVALFHQRYSTNTFPTWALAQPLRMLGHNGEINTIEGNRNWMRAREAALAALEPDLVPVLVEGGSDSTSLDNALELLVRGGRSLVHAAAMLVPPAGDGSDPQREAFDEFHAGLMEPWDGPAALCLTDGRIAAACLDRNGLRPLRYEVTAEGLLVVGSEAGLVDHGPRGDQILHRGRLGPGQMLAVDLASGELLDDAALRATLAAQRPWQAWLEAHRVSAGPIDSSAGAPPAPPEDEAERIQLQQVFGYGKEACDRILEPMLYDGDGAIGSMGNDAPLAALSARPQPLHCYFQQRFAQVTNPPIDPLRERAVMSLRTLVGPRGDIFLEDRPATAALVSFPSPFIDEAQYAWLCAHFEGTRVVQARWRVADGLEAMERALEALCAQVLEAVEGGCPLVVLSDRAVDAEHAPIPMLLALSAVHQRLLDCGRRMQVGLVCDTGEPREDHHLACLLGFGADLVHPWLALRSVRAIAREDPRGAGISVQAAAKRYLAAAEKGLRKILARMGISCVASYRGAQIFEAVGLRAELVERWFGRTLRHRLGGVGALELARDVAAFHAEAYGPESSLTERGMFRFRRQGEFHAFNPGVFKLLHQAVRSGDASVYARYAAEVNARAPRTVRDLLRWRAAGPPLPLEAVEPASSIARRFCTGAMSYGALSQETHELLAVAMNRLGGKSNSGEGGEDEARYVRYTEAQVERSRAPWHPQAGDWGRSAIKQVASARFGVTPYYLVSADELEIKMAQGAKPGEGGQIPADKVSEAIARVRRAPPGITLISPPPHHDIYSIEDLAQLIYDLKRVNAEARVAVKLVSGVGIGTVAAGVAKAYADIIQISGHDGGTGASPLSSIKHAGLPWEIGLAEAQQVLVKNDLRGRVLLRVDGGLQTGRDVVLAALLGAEEFGFGTSALVAAGCVMARQCHLNTCPVGIATQREELRERFPGRPEHVIALMLFIAEEVRHVLAELGVPSLETLVGRTDLLEVRRDVELPRAALDLSSIVADPDPGGGRPRRRHQPRNDRPEASPPLDETLLLACGELLDALRTGADGVGAVSLAYDIDNSERSVGARLSGELARLTSGRGLPPGTVSVRLRGTAGQSFGAFAIGGLELVLEGVAQDYVGKGLAGAELVVLGDGLAGSVVLGNTALYGATSGALYAAGTAGERLAVRNSGAQLVVEGCGDHGCEYMTGGTAVILGAVGRNFGAGMTGGAAYLLSEGGVAEVASRLNPEMVEAVAVEAESSDASRLAALVARHAEKTGSALALALLEDWPRSLERFVCVRPRGAAVHQRSAA